MANVQNENEPYLLTDGQWTVRVRRPADPGAAAEPARVFLLIHGLTGDENIMWIFTRGLPKNAWIFSPRAPIAWPKGGYSWVNRSQEELSVLDDFVDVAHRLYEAFERWRSISDAPQSSFDVMGFSQGAGLAYTLAALYPQHVSRVIALAGFLPRDESAAGGEPGRYSALKGKPVFIAHGTRDETVPVQLARDAVDLLNAAGAKVTFCESDVGHKLGANCLRGLDKFILSEPSP